MKYLQAILTFLLLLPALSIASEDLDIVEITYRIQDLETELAEPAPGRIHHKLNQRPIAEAEVKLMMAAIRAPQLPCPFVYHYQKITAEISAIIGEIPAGLLADENPFGHLYIHSVPDLSKDDMHDKPIPDFDSVYYYLDEKGVRHYFGFTIINNKFVGQRKKTNL